MGMGVGPAMGLGLGLGRGGGGVDAGAGDRHGVRHGDGVLNQLLQRRHALQ